jgi:hypothetical protein
MNAFVPSKYPIMVNPNRDLTAGRLRRQCSEELETGNES